MRLFAVCLSFAYLALGIISCEQDSDTPNIVGTWREEIYDEDFDRISRLEYISRRQESCRY
jgi:hypothetical protein